MFVIPASQHNLRRNTRLIARLHGACTWGFSHQLNIGADGILQNYCQVLDCEPRAWTPEVMEKLVGACFCQYERPARTIPEFVHWINLSSDEHRIIQYYSAAAGGGRTLPLAEQVQLCTYYGLHLHKFGTVELQPLPKAAERLRKIHVRRMTTLRARTDENITRLTATTCANGSGLPRSRYDKLLRRIQRSQRKMGDLQRGLVYFDSSVKNMQETKTTPASKCPICMEHNGDTLTVCGHVYCRMCITQYIDEARHTANLHLETDSNVHITPPCPICKQPLEWSSIYQIMGLVDNAYGSKLTVVYQQVCQWASRGERAIICSQYMPLLKICQAMFHDKGVTAYFLNGSNKRGALERFHQARSVPVSAQNNAVLLVDLTAESTLATAIADSDASATSAIHLVMLHGLVGDNVGDRMAIYRRIRTLCAGVVDVHWFLAYDTAEQHDCDAGFQWERAFTGTETAAPSVQTHRVECPTQHAGLGAC
jgi:hypothetical protein